MYIDREVGGIPPYIQKDESNSINIITLEKSFGSPALGYLCALFTGVLLNYN